MNNHARPRLRELGINIGRYPCGEKNAITDVAGVLVGHKTVIRDDPSPVRTGVTVIMPRGGEVRNDPAFAGFFSFNGIGEMTGLPVIEEWGLLTSPILLTNTNQVGTARDALIRHAVEAHGGFSYKLPVIAETYDGYLSDSDAFPLTIADFDEALHCLSDGPVMEGSVGGGTGMICYEFKGGIGTASRLVQAGGVEFTLGVLVQANHGSRHLLTVNGVPVGNELNTEVIPSPFQRQDGSKDTPVPDAESSSIVVVIATDAPLLPGQCQRLARRATVGLARTGGVGYNSSGDLFLAFATGNHYQSRDEKVKMLPLQMLAYEAMDPLIEATAEAVEEAILNTLTAADTMTGYKDRIAYGLPLDRFTEVMEKYHRKS